MKKVLLSSAVALSLFAAAAPVFAEGTASLWVNDIDNNEVPQGSTDSESNKVMDELQAYRDAQSALDQQVAEAKKAPVGKSAVMEDQAGNKVLVIGEGESANADQPSAARLIRQHLTPQPLHQFRLFQHRLNLRRRPLQQQVKRRLKNQKIKQKKLRKQKKRTRKMRRILKKSHFLRQVQSNNFVFNLC